MNWVYVVNRVLLVAALGGGVSFIVIYWLTARWWASGAGRYLMALAVSETIILGISVAVWLFGDFPWRVWVALGAFGLFTVTSWWRTVVLIRLLLSRRNGSVDPPTGSQADPANASSPS